uniref:hypothetical protein n=1 Tax=Trichocoleus desertorum TaxID=1481672 RepID=UPI0025B5F389|nr:hypothetical protein [Trichocoleus desertorum]
MCFSPIQRILTRMIAMLGLLVALVLAQPTVASAATVSVATNPLYINAVLTEPSTRLGQRPKVVQTYGNRGPNPLANVNTFCEYSPLSATWAIALNFDVIDRPQQIIPGQNTNRETAIRTVTPGQVRVVCQVSGRDAVTNEEFTAFSRPLVLTVNP